MRRNIPLFLVLAVVSESFATKEIDKLFYLCGPAMILKDHELDKDYKNRFNEWIEVIELKEAFNFSGETIRDNLNLAGLYLKDFNFTKAKLIDLSLKDSRLDKAIFNGTTFERVDFSGNDLKDVKFVNCRFRDCNLEGCNLTDTTLEGCKFKKVQLDGAILCEGLKYDKKLSDLDQVMSYAKFIKEGEREKAKGLNKIFSVKKLKLKKADLRGLDLNGINFERANLKDAQLQGVQLSDSVVLPDYEGEVELIRLYSKYIRSGKKDDAKTLNTILPALQINEGEVDLRGLDLTGINLKGTELMGAELQGTNLTNANLKYTNLDTECLYGVILSDDLTLHFNDMRELRNEWMKDGPHKPLYQKLLNARVPILQDSSKEEVKEIKWAGMDLRNVKFSYLDLEGIDFTNYNLKNAWFDDTKLTNVIFTNANLKKTYFYGAQLTNIKFINANFKKASLNNKNCTDVDFTNANLAKVVLWFDRDANFKKAWLSKNLQIDYKENYNELFYEWAKDDSNRPLYQNLINRGFPILVDIPTEELQKVNWQGLNLSYAVIENVCFKDIVFRDVHFYSSKFVNVRFENCKFIKVFFMRARLDAGFNSCFFDQTTFSYEDQIAKFNDCDFKDIQLNCMDSGYYQEEKIGHARIVQAYSRFMISHSNTNDLVFRNGYMFFNFFLSGLKLNLSGTDLKNLNLQGINLRGANLEGADLSGSDLSGADLRGSHLKEANLIGCLLSQAILDDSIGRFDEGYNGSFLIEFTGVLGEAKSDDPPLKRLKTE